MTTKSKPMLQKHFVVSHHPLCPYTYSAVTIFEVTTRSVILKTYFRELNWKSLPVNDYPKRYRNEYNCHDI